MVGNNAGPGGPAVPPVWLVEAVYPRIISDSARFLRTARSGAITFSPHALAVLVAELVTEHITALSQAHSRMSDTTARLRTGLSGALGYTFPDGYPGDERALADLRELAGEARVRENEVIALGCEVEKLERALDEAARDSETAARFVDTMLSGGGGR